MKYHKFEKIIKGDNPIIRITFKDWRHRLYERDVIKSVVNDWWIFMDDGELVETCPRPISNFHKNDNDVYLVNGKGPNQVI